MSTLLSEHRDGVLIVVGAGTYSENIDLLGKNIRVVGHSIKDGVHDVYAIPSANGSIEKPISRTCCGSGSCSMTWVSPLPAPSRP